MCLRVLPVVFAFALSCLMQAVVSAADFNCFVTDPIGDATVSSGQGFVGEPYQDIVRSEVSRTGTSITFAMDLAAPIPAAPEVKTGNGRILWMWGVSTGPDAPQGYPLGAGVAGVLEFWIDVNWNGKSFSAEFVDRRPSLTGGDPIITVVPFTMVGSHVGVTVDSSRLGDPASFSWGSSTWALPASHIGNTDLHKLDAAPIGGLRCP